MASNPSPHVLIIGGGIGGLTLGQALRKQDISFEVFERDTEANSRSQGWAILLHTVLAQLKAFLPEDMPPIETVNHLLPLDLPAQIIMYDGARPDVRVGSESTPEQPLLRANRGRLRDWLATSIPIRFGKQAVGIEENDGRVTVRFKDGTSSTGDFVVGADGKHSSVRKHLLGHRDRLRVVPIAIAAGELTVSGDEMIRQLEIAHSSYAAMAPAPPDDPSQVDVMLFTGLAQPVTNSDGKVAGGDYYWLISVADESIATERPWTAAATQEELLNWSKEMAKPLSEEFRRIVDLTPAEGMRVPPLILHDIELSSQDIPAGRVTLLGDAAHCMAPYLGEGGVIALRDSFDLAHALTKISEGGDMKHYMAAYRDTMLERGVAAVRKTRNAFGKLCSTACAPPVAFGYPTVELPKKKIVL
ncbi:putative monooxygenase [Podospora appendiculata]|uniref:Monooxygenase n=1 Tax=Podospora appendiculata TaxID=314037 RepID=A0AAE1CG52_9PEZI|nr:putative monooxygenase [Podospora appendiculata]